MSDPGTRCFAWLGPSLPWRAWIVPSMATLASLYDWQTKAAVGSDQQDLRAVTRAMKRQAAGQAPVFLAMRTAI